MRRTDSTWSRNSCDCCSASICPTIAPSRRTSSRSSASVSENSTSRRGAEVSVFDTDEFIPKAYTPRRDAREKARPTTQEPLQPRALGRAVIRPCQKARAAAPTDRSRIPTQRLVAQDPRMPTMYPSPPSSHWLTRLRARLARRDRWPRKWWWPPQDKATLSPENTDDYVDRHREISATIRFSMIGLIGFSFFCGLTLAVPDSVVLTGAGKIPVPFANTDIDFGTFITIGPLLLIAYTLYLHIFIGQLLKLPELPEVDRSTALFNLRGRVPAFLTYLVFYWLAPATVVLFAVRAAPLKAGTWLYFLAAVFLIVLLVLQLRRSPYPWRWARPMLWLLVLAVA